MSGLETGATPMFTEAASAAAQGQPGLMNAAMGSTDWTSAAPGKAVDWMKMAKTGQQALKQDERQQPQMPMDDSPAMTKQQMTQEMIRRKWLAMNQPGLFQKLYGGQHG
jgi:hypothetical protein